MTRGKIIAVVLFATQFVLIQNLVSAQQSEAQDSILQPIKNPRNLNQLDKAYLDALTILSGDNQCSQFFGGRSAISALGALVSELRPTYLDRNTAIRMRGETTVFHNQKTGMAYRLFSKAELNLGGPFYRSDSLYEERLPLIAGFRPNTREVRVTVLLHELGHLLRGPDSQWLLPDDGNDSGQSRKNTERVIEVCRAEILASGELTAFEQLRRARGELAQKLTSVEGGP